MANEPIPVYVFTGFLESGKTKFIQDILADPNFTENERTVLLLCEEGIEEYDEKWLLHYGTALVPIESEDRLTPNILKRIEQKYQPERMGDARRAELERINKISRNRNFKGYFGLRKHKHRK